MDIILDELGPEVETLESCSLTCRSWLARSTENLFKHSRVRIYSTEDEADLIHALQPPGRVQQNVVKLSLFHLSFEQWRLVAGLPRLRDFTVYCCAGCGSEHEGSVVPPPVSTGRSIGLLNIDCVPLPMLVWLLRLFSAVDTLQLRCIDPTGLPPPAPGMRLTVANLDMRILPAQTFAYLTAALNADALESLTIDAASPYQAEDGHETLVSDFVRVNGRHIKRYHHINHMSGYNAPYPPDLSSCPGLTSVALTTDALNPFYNTDGLRRALAFLDALPPGVQRITV